MNIQYLTGDATDPSNEGNQNKLIIHCCNDKKRWGSGFVMALSAKWKDPEVAYNNWNFDTFKLGAIQIVPVEGNISICNMVGQHDIMDINGVPPIRYESIRTCLQEVAKHCLKTDSSVHAPRFGGDRAGGKWSKIEELINEELISKGIPVYIYDLDNKDYKFR